MKYRMMISSCLMSLLFACSSSAEVPDPKTYSGKWISDHRCHDMGGDYMRAVFNMSKEEIKTVLSHEKAEYKCEKSCNEGITVYKHDVEMKPVGNDTYKKVEGIVKIIKFIVVGENKIKITDVYERNPYSYYKDTYTRYSDEKSEKEAFDDYGSNNCPKE